MKSIDTYDFSGKRAIIRVDFNVPLDKKTLVITGDTRIRAALGTINKVLEQGGSVILMSHLGRPDKGPEDKFSLRHILAHLSSLLKKEVKFADDCIGESAKKMSSELKAGEVLLLENLRFYEEEEGKPRLPENVTDEEKKAAKEKTKASQKEFVKKLASLADCYINDAFGTAHRAHASTALIAASFPNDKMFGYLMESEVKSIDKVLANPARPFTAVMGGAKVSDKILIIENLLSKVDNLILGGGMVYTFVKALGGTVGNSICEHDKLDVALALLEKAKANNVKFILPVDNIIADKFDNEANTEYAKIADGKEGWMGLDIADETIALYCNVIENSKTILWNGPMGVFEMEKFQKGTVEVAKAIVRATEKGAFSLVGGGDSVAAVNKYNMADKVSYVSTGGGALLESFEGKVLPGIKAVREA